MATVNIVCFNYRIMFPEHTVYVQCTLKYQAEVSKAAWIQPDTTRNSVQHRDELVTWVL